MKRVTRVLSVGAALVAFAWVAALAAFGAFRPATHFDAIPEDPFTKPAPAGFLWGAATAAHQVEGGNSRNDWARFEAQPGRILGGDRSGVAADHWNRGPEDIALLKSLGGNAYRFSIEWSRLEPAPGTWDDAAWAHYADEVTALRAQGIEPMVTLLHFTLPAWLADPWRPHRPRSGAPPVARRPLLVHVRLVNGADVQRISRGHLASGTQGSSTGGKSLRGSRARSREGGGGPALLAT